MSSERVNEKIARALASARSERELAQAATDVARVAAVSGAPVLHEWERALGALNRSALSEEGRGYARAVAHMLAGLIEAQERRDAAAAAAAEAASPRWSKLLSALAPGPATPTELATRTGLDPSVVSRTLRELRAADFVESAPAPLLGGDGRTKWVQLTGQGARHATKAFAPPPGARAVAEIAGELFSALLVDGRAYRADLPADPLSHWAFESLVAQAVEKSAVESPSTGVVIARDTGVGHLLRAYLNRAGGVEELVDRLYGAAPVPPIVVVRSSRHVDQWHHVAARSPRPLDVVVTGALALFEAPDRCRLIFDSKPLEQRDRRNKEAQSLLDSASSVALIGADDRGELVVRPVEAAA